MPTPSDTFFCSRVPFYVDVLLLRFDNMSQHRWGSLSTALGSAAIPLQGIMKHEVMLQTLSNLDFVSISVAMCDSLMTSVYFWGQFFLSMLDHFEKSLQCSDVGLRRAQFSQSMAPLVQCGPCDEKLECALCNWRCAMRGS